MVYHEGKWHLFCTVRGKKRSHQIEYVSFAKWEEAGKGKRRFLGITDGYYCAPQVFYFRPHIKWYLIYQASDPGRPVELQPAFSTTHEIGNPESWSKPQFLFPAHPANVKMWIDFWVICDDTRAHLFFTSLDGRMWRSETALSAFPTGWSEPSVVLQDDIFEASHTYRVKGSDSYLTLVEAQNNGRRYYKAYVADKLDGQWKALASTRDNAFASPANVQFEGPSWSDSFSHGELLRASNDERHEIDPANLTFLYQGVSDRDRVGKNYGDIPWKLGLLKLRK